MHAMRRGGAVALVGLTLFTGCAHTVTISSDPEEAHITIAGVTQGRTPFIFLDQHGAGRDYVVTIEKSGYDPLKVTIQQEWNSSCVVGSIVGGVLLLGIPLIGLLFCHQLKNAYAFPLDPAPVLLPEATLGSLSPGRRALIDAARDEMSAADQDYLRASDLRDQLGAQIAAHAALLSTTDAKSRLAKAGVLTAAALERRRVARTQYALLSARLAAEQRTADKRAMDPPWQSAEGYQGIRWGMSREDVQKLMPQAATDKSEAILSFAGPVADIPANTLLYFAQNRLTGVALIFHPVGRLRSVDEGFGALQAALASKYGGHGDRLEDGGFLWDTGKTRIQLQRDPMNILQPLTVRYDSKELSFLRAKLDDAAIKDL